MNTRRTILTILSVLIVFSMIFGSAAAEDGQLFRRNVSKTPEFQTDQAAIYMMDFYVPAQKSTGEVYTEALEYTLADTTVAADYEGRLFAKPLVTTYDDGISEHQFISEEASPIAIDGGVIFGSFDGYIGVSLDDGTSWKTTNVSRSADLSSFTLQDGTEYPGHVHKIVHQVAGDQIFVAWISKYCEGGTPLYTLDAVENADYFADLEETYSKDAVYLFDLFGVGGTQGSVDYTDQGWPEVGEIPYSCVWTARGKLIAGDDPATDAAEATYVVWAKAERLTSGARDANLPAVDCAYGAGCILTWQEDPEGLRPGTGLGPGEGWSGAVANGKTDIWYSYISYADFDLVFAAEDTVGAITMAEYALLTDATMPKSYVPMAMPTRLTDNNMCKATNTALEPSEPYCYIDFDTIDDIDHTNIDTFLEGLDGPEADADFCLSEVAWTTPGGSIINICVTDDGRVMNGRVAATRVRLNLKPYTPTDAVDIDDDGVVEKSAWVIMAAEETKAMGDLLVDYLGVPTDDPLDIGKDVWYYSFDMFDHPLADQGGILNQPATCSPWTVGATVDCTDYEFFPVQTDPLNGGDFYLTEIARRFALTTNPVNLITESEAKLSAMLIFKQGIINQGGPADIMLRRVVAPDDFDPAVDNPYAFENMACDEWAYTDGTNPNYLQGICLSPAINISGTTIVECDGATGNDACAATFPVADDGSIPDAETSFPKMLEWRQCDGVASIEGCESDNDLDDQSWESPFDIAKGHRGFLDGDYVMMMYAWSPNWKANSVGNDHYNLYVRRSFDGGLTWTTTPAALGGAGVTVSENYCVETSAEECVGTEFTYAAGAYEQGRNVSQLIGNKITILDPRYSPTGGMKLYPTIRTDWLTNNGFTFTDLPYFDDLERDPSKFFMIYETGDNTTSAEGEATPLDLFYSRASVYGDVWELDPDYITVDEYGNIVDVVDYRWNWDEHDQAILSGEAGMLANPGGTFMYAVWNQWEEEIIIDEFGHEHENHLYLPDDTLETTAPVAEIMVAPSAALAYDQLTFIGSGFDADDLDGENNIVSYEWYSSLDGHIGSGQTLIKPADQLSIGRHIITLVVTDNEGVTGTTTDFLVIDGGAFHTTLPFITR